MDEDIFDKFSRHDWILLEAGFEEHKAGAFMETVVWKDAYKDDGAVAEWWKAHLYELVVSSALKGYHIIEGRPLAYPQIASRLLTDLSTHQTAYWFQINLWLPLMQFKIFEKGQSIREYELFYDSKINKLQEINEGRKWAIEEEAKQILTVEEYRDFWLPLAIMEKMGLPEQLILDALHQPCRKLTISEEFRKMIDQANAEPE